ncbi:hypothetical protein DUNSADRAFT_9414 [Dunaliella salina]|uniref:Endoplasmic reticulum-based factor for assembly of v-atpase n=1 Tax=Dunaliella salina TaxID=3046 RepID=A0ABQ7GHJ6_DUNSA|nr:hypothetical protein DUNSADRAFT_9414 [Dunaliella salina]|eukprot:KAF5834064.1 hypothetical protein DUNSADRAFT_9414 [Dunaliella salina]
MLISIRPPLQQLLKEAAAFPHVPKDLQDQALICMDHTEIPWTTLKTLVFQLREHGMETPPLQQVCQFQDVLYQGHSIAQPRPPKSPSPELVARRKQLQARLDNFSYEGMVADITAQEREAEHMKDLLPTTRAQLSYGAHVLVIMFTFSLLGYMVTKLYFKGDELWAGLFGCLGLAMGLLVEVLLLVIRTNRPALTPEERYPALFKSPPLKHSKQSPGSRGVSQSLPEGQRPSSLSRRSKKQASGAMSPNACEETKEGLVTSTGGKSGSVNVLGGVNTAEDLVCSPEAEGSAQTCRLEKSDEAASKRKCA